jgi:hypothetical protein
MAWACGRIRASTFRASPTSIGHERPGAEKFVPMRPPNRDAIFALDAPRPALVQAQLLAGRLARRAASSLVKLQTRAGRVR